MTASPSERLDVLETKVDLVIERVDAIHLRLTEFQSETRQEFAAVRREMADGFATVRQETAAMATDLRKDIREGDEETRQHALVLHEDLISRIKTIGEGIDGLRDR